jgi:hypothetical protein
MHELQLKQAQLDKLKRQEEYRAELRRATELKKAGEM